jgi:ZIP family zinc transporter
MLDPQAVLLSILASMTTSLGAALVFLVKGTSHRTRDALVGFSAGLMLSVTALNLLPRALGPNQQNLLQVII